MNKNIDCGLSCSTSWIGWDRLDTYMLFSKAPLLSSSVSATAEDWLEASSIKAELLSSAMALVDWVSWRGADSGFSH